MRLVASMIVKDELDRYLPLAVKHLLTYVDEVRVLDDGSTDGSYEWLQEQENVEVLRNPGPAFFEHEGQARQNLFEWTRHGLPDYVLAIDADELLSTSPDLLRAAIEEREADVYILSLVEAWVVSERGVDIRVDGQWGPRRVPILYRTPRGARHWRIADRKLACGREPQEVVKASRRGIESGATILHFGWTRSSERNTRAERYFEHDQGKFHQNRHLQSILWQDKRVKLRRLPWPPALKSISDELIAHSDR